MLLESDLEGLGFKKKLMLGTGWLTIVSMRDPIYYYDHPCGISISCEEIWRWYVDDEQDNSIAVYSKERLKQLIKQYA